MTAPVLPWQTTEALPLRGIDVSAVFPRPEDLTPDRVRDLDFAFVRAAYGDRPDTVAARYVARLRDLKPSLHVAPYAFLRHGTTAKSNPERQAAAIREGVSPFDLTKARVWFDLEDNTKNDGPWSSSRALEIWRHVIATAVGSGARPEFGGSKFVSGIYTAPGWFRAVFPSVLPEWRDLPYWLAHWGTATSARPSPLVFSDGSRAQIAAWQFGRIDLGGGLLVDGNVANWGILSAPPSQPQPPAPPVTPPPAPAPLRGLLEQLAAELDGAAASLDTAATALGDLPADHPARLHVARARAALRRARTP